MSIKPPLKAKPAAAPSEQVEPRCLLIIGPWALRTPQPKPERQKPRRRNPQPRFNFDRAEP